MSKCPYCDEEVNYSDVMCQNCGRLIPDEDDEDNDYVGMKKPRRLSTGGGRHTGRYILLICLILFLILPQTSPQRKRVGEYPGDPSKILDDLKELLDLINSEYYKVAASATFMIERTLEIKASGGEVQFSLRVPYPINVTARDGTQIHTIRDLNCNYPAHKVTRTRSDPWIYFNGSAQDGETVKVILTYDIATKTYIWDEISSKNSGTVDQIPQYLKDQYNHDEYKNHGSDVSQLIKLDDVRDVAQEITSEKSTVYGKVKAIYKYIVDKIAYQVGTVPKPCKETLEGKVGDCDDMVLLFSAMCRAVDIPAYPGYGFISNQKFEGWGGHSWANVVIPDKNGNIHIPHIDLPNRRFLWYDVYRLIEWNGDGNEDHLSEYYHIHQSIRNGDASSSFSQKFKTIAYHTDGEQIIRAD